MMHAAGAKRASTDKAMTRRLKERVAEGGREGKRRGGSDTNPFLRVSRMSPYSGITKEDI